MHFEWTMDSFKIALIWLIVYFVYYYRNNWELLIAPLHYNITKIINTD